MKLIISYILLAISIVLFSSCKKQVLQSEDPGMLEQIGILGTWEIQSYQVNGVTNMAIYCCEFTEFNDDNQPDDNNGTYRSYGSGVESNGKFTIDVKKSTISFGDSSNKKVYDYQIQDNNLTISYSKDEDEIIETYIKRG